MVLNLTSRKRSFVEITQDTPKPPGLPSATACTMLYLPCVLATAEKEKVKTPASSAGRCLNGAFSQREFPGCLFWHSTQCSPAGEWKTARPDSSKSHPRSEAKHPFLLPRAADKPAHLQCLILYSKTVFPQALWLGFNSLVLLPSLLILL